MWQIVMCMYMVDSLFYIYLELNDDDIVEHDFEVNQLQFTFKQWLKIEILIILSYIVGNMVWLFIRSLVHNTREIIPPTKILTPKMDYLEANVTILGIFEIFFTPAFVSIMITYEQELLSAFEEV